ncbi:MAG: PKD domain-containing protein [Bacteroidales bacterium]|nr:PKD domain-containing protein [Bacteroidales bacterium]
MKHRYLYVLVFGILAFGSKFSFAQIETRLASNCAINNLEVPINIKNLENIKSFQLKLLYNTELLQLDTSLYHNSEFTINNDENYRIITSASNDTITITWSAFYSVNIADDLMLSLVFTEKGSGDAVFSWIEEECFYKNINNLNVDAVYIVDEALSIPFQSTVEISFEQFTIGCRDDSESGGCKAQAEVNIIGGQSPYSYHWNDKFNQNDSIAIGLCQAPISVEIRDALGCIYASVFDPVTYPASVYSIVADPEIVYITRPEVEFSMETEDLYIETYEWDFGDESNATTEFATHTYAQVDTYDISLKTENIDGCDTIVYLKNFEVKELNFCIPNVFTPNGDNINDTWVYKIIGAGSDDGSSDGLLKSTGLSEVKKCSGEDLIFDDHFKSSNLVVLNRHGSTVFECTNCSDYWDGGNLPDGVYYYVFIWEGEYSHGREQGNVTIIGSKN